MAVRHSDEFWRPILAEYAGGGITYEALATKHAVNLHTLKRRVFAARSARSAQKSVKRGGGVQAAKFLPVVEAHQPEPRESTPLVVVVGDDAEAIAHLVRRLRQC